MGNDRKKKIVAVASIGGHWIQLLRITRTLESEFDVSYVSTHEKCGVMVILTSRSRTSAGGMRIS